MHQLATAGALILAVGQLIFVWNLVTSWLEGPEVDDGDPWDLDETGQRTREWDWFGRKLETAVPDGGTASKASSTSSELRSDGGSGSDTEEQT
jgi:cytochrome c oxidase subunit 1